MGVDPRQLEQPLTYKETLLRDSYVSEYLKDFDSFKACLRLGFQATFASVWAETLFRDGYVQRKLSHMLSQVRSGPEQEAEDRALVETTLRQVMLRGSDTARANAAQKMMVLRGWDKTAGGDEPDGDLSEQFRRLSQELPS